ncbi:hypothetical protein EBAPG3_013245 [Nitrosospira lacus]|uniref:DUF2846 domain-containing protein n=1 Tax=Nitrosospira lacus TaxID=1288494 RepID=A0A1W6SS87_9PROT|nr:hypothetical protein [Nitrosospira lacus]ARO88657.1 hypothetical protein EBAPG3_013245 [Nitrosospira lacus]
MRTTVTIQASLFFLLSMLPALLFAQQVTTCTNPVGHAYFAHKGVLAKEDSEWKIDTVPKGAFTLRKFGKDDFDIIFIDSTKRNHSTAQDGAKVFPLRRNETEAAFLVHYHDSEESQIYSFFKENSGAARFSVLVSKGGPSIYKSSVMVGDCTPINFKLINEGDSQ